MWVRSQNGEIIVKVENVAIKDKKRVVSVSGTQIAFLGEYKSNKRVMEVLDEFQVAIEAEDVLFQMPKE